MPNIETFESKTPAPRADTQGSQAFEIEGRHVEASYAAAGQQIGSGISAVGSAIEEHDALAQTSTLVKGAADIDLKTAQDLENAKTTMDPHDPDAMKAFLDAHQEQWDKLGEGITNTKAKMAFDRMRADYQVNTGRSFLTTQTAAAANDIVSNYSQGADTRANLALGDPTQTQTQIDAMAAGAVGLPVEHRTPVMNAAISKIADSGADGVVQKVLGNPNASPQDVQTAKDYLADPKNPFIANMSPSKFAEVNDKLDRIKNTQGVVASTIANQAFSGVLTQARETGDPTAIANGQKLIDNTVEKTPGETAIKKSEMQRNLDAAAVYGTTIRSTGAMSASQDDVQKMITDAQTAANSAAPDDIAKSQEKVQALTDFAKQRDAAFGADQVGYVTKNDPVVNARFSAWQKDQTPQNFQAYVQTSIATQQHLYPSRPVQYVSKDVESTIGGALNGALAGKEGPAAVGSALQSYAQNAGPYWSNIAQQLRKDKVVSGSVGVGAELYGSPQTQALGEQVIRASALQPKELEEKFGVKRDKAIAAVSDAMKPLMATMENMPNGDRLIADYRNAAADAVQYSGDANSAGATINKMLVDRYDIANTTIRIPKSLGLDADRIQDGTRVLQAGIGSRQLIMPPDFTQHGISPDRYGAQVRETGKWFTNETNTGAVLYDQDGHTVKEVKNGKAQDVEVKWNDIGSAADTLPGRRAYKAVTGALDNVIGGR